MMDENQNAVESIEVESACVEPVMEAASATAPAQTMPMASFKTTMVNTAAGVACGMLVNAVLGVAVNAASAAGHKVVSAVSQKWEERKQRKALAALEAATAPETPEPESSEEA